MRGSSAEIEEVKALLLIALPFPGLCKYHSLSSIRGGSTYLYPNGQESFSSNSVRRDNDTRVQLGAAPCDSI